MRHDPTFSSPDRDVGAERRARYHRAGRHRDIGVDQARLRIEHAVDPQDLAVSCRTSRRAGQDGPALAGMNAVAIARLDADGDDEPVETSQRHQGGARLHAVTLGDRDRRHDAVERRRQGLRRTAGALPVQRVECRLRVGHCLVGLRELISRRQLLPQQLRGVRPLLPRTASALTAC